MKRICNNQGSLKENISNRQVFKGMKYNLSAHNNYFVSYLFIISIFICKVCRLSPQCRVSA